MKSDMLEYNGYKATVAYDKDDNIFIGEVFGVSDSLNFHGRSTKELNSAFRECIDNYEDYCKQIGKEPQKEFSGSFNIRTSPDIHRQASEYAAKNGISLNQVVSMAMEAFLGKKKMQKQ